MSREKQLEDPYRLGVIADAGLVSKTILAGGAMAATIVAVKVLHGDSFEIGSLTVPLKHAWCAVAAFTIAHAYTGRLLFEAVYSSWMKSGASERRHLFEMLTLAGGLAMRGMQSRRLVPGKMFYRMSGRDPTSWLFLGLVVLILGACVPFEFTGWWSTAAHVLIAVYLCLVNWLVGSKWSIAIGGLRDEGSYYLDMTRYARERIFRPSEFYVS